MGSEKGRCGEYLSESAFADTSQEDKVKEIDVSFEVDGLRKRWDNGAGGARGGLTVGRQQTAPIARGN